MPSASLIITNAKVITEDSTRPQAEALVVEGNRIVFVGNRGEAEAWAHPATRLIDAQGKALLPGFIDCHYHLLMGSAELENALLDEVDTLDDLTVALRRYVAERPLQTGTNPAEAWVNASHLKYLTLPEGSGLTRRHLDAILPDRPLVIMAFDYHTVWANSRALELAGILSGGNAGPNGEIVLGSDGLASGELREPTAYSQVLRMTGVWGQAASGLLDLQATAHSPADRLEELAALRQGLALTASYGVTSIHNMDGSAHQADLLALLEKTGELSARLYLPINVTPDTPLEALKEAVALRQTCMGGMLRAGLVKFFMDGVMESWTACLVDDYSDRPGFRAHSNYSQEQFNSLAGECDRLGLQIAVHAIGDAAVRRTLDGFEAVRLQNGGRDSRHRIEHIELVHPDDIPRFARLGVIASMQPLHASSAGALWYQRTGERRWPYGFAWQTLRQAGARLVFGSDWPVVVQDPMQAIQVAMHRQPWKSGLPDQRQRLEQAIASYTSQAAYAEFQEHQKGRLIPGFLADLVLLSDDLEHTPVEEIGHIRPLMTVCNGRVVYEQAA